MNMVLVCSYFLKPVNGWINHWLYVKLDSNIVQCLFADVAAVFCCVGALALVGALHHVDKDLLGWWLCERQVKSGGLNGRPEKLPDVGIFSQTPKSTFVWEYAHHHLIELVRFATHGGYFLAQS